MNQKVKDNKNKKKKNNNYSSNSLDKNGVGWQFGGAG